MLVWFIVGIAYFIHLTAVFIYLFNMYSSTLQGSPGFCYCEQYCLIIVEHAIYCIIIFIIIIIMQEPLFAIYHGVELLGHKVCKCST